MRRSLALIALLFAGCEDPATVHLLPDQCVQVVGYDSVSVLTPEDGRQWPIGSFEARRPEIQTGVTAVVVEDPDFASREPGMDEHRLVRIKPKVFPIRGRDASFADGCRIERRNLRVVDHL